MTDALIFAAVVVVLVAVVAPLARWRLIRESYVTVTLTLDVERFRRATSEISRAFAEVERAMAPLVAASAQTVAAMQRLGDAWRAGDGRG